MLKIDKTKYPNKSKIEILVKCNVAAETKFKEDYENGIMIVSVAHTQNEKEAEKFKEEIIASMPKVKFGYINPLSLSVACHIGPGALAISLCKTGINK